MAKTPVIFLAFANDRVDDEAYLRNLPKELHSIREALEEGAKAGLCEVVERANATIDSILDVFQDSRYRDRIAIFHYGGHANGYQLLLENMDGSHASAHSEGLISFLGKQIGLQLVFLNGCSSQQQALDLVQAGIPAVIGTSQSINDDLATMLSMRFYQALGNGSNLERAWMEAVDQAKIQKGTANMRDLFWEGAETEIKLDRFPWDIYYRDGEELVKHWNLPESTENPLFGLPTPKTQFDLPEQPYRFLQRYSKEHADIFFGRSYYIRDLYNSATDPIAAPILLFYGQSGVGKSSMLDAGVFPRLEQSRQVVYIRRKQSIGLLGVLKQALGFDIAENNLAIQQEDRNEVKEQLEQLEQIKTRNKSKDIQSNIQVVIDKLRGQLRGEVSVQDNIEDDRSLKDAWLAIEKQYDTPLVILLDQVEECFTYPNQELRGELEAFLDAVRAIFYDKRNRPKGKLILSYRKEYHPEIKEACIERGIPREEIFLKALARKDIIEIVKGLTLTDRLKRNYRLAVEDNLPVIIADDLLEDRDSPVAPVLQILLTKMWKMTEPEEHRIFSVDRYQSLRAEGILMDDFFQEQMAQLEMSFPEEVASGLALGLLQQHTTRLGTAGTKSLDELRELYSDRQERLEQLLVKLKDLYLIAASDSQTVGLAHDTLAPLVLQEFRNSNKPAQRAAIILDNKLLAFQQDGENVIDSDDLRIVEEGAYGMPLFTLKEQELIEKSQAKAAALEAEKKQIRQRELRDAARIKRNLRIAVVLAIMAVFLATGAGYFYLEADGAKHEAEANAAKAQESEQKALVSEEEAKKSTTNALLAKKQAEEEKQYAIQQKLEADSAKVFAQRQQEATEIAKIQAEAARVEAIKEKNEAEQARIDALLAKIKAEKSEIKATTQEKQTQRLSALATSNAMAVKSLSISDPNIKARLAKQAYIAHTNNDGDIFNADIYQALYQALKALEPPKGLSSKPFNSLRGHVNAIREISVFNNQLYTVGSDKKVMSTILPFGSDSLNLLASEKEILKSIVLRSDGNGLAWGTQNGKVIIFNSPEADTTAVPLPTVAEVVKLREANHGNLIALQASKDRPITIISASGEVKQSIAPRCKGVIQDLAISNNKQYMAVGTDQGDLIILDLAQNYQEIVLDTLGTDNFWSLAFSPDNQKLVVGSVDGSLYYYDISSNKTAAKKNSFLKVHQARITDINFNSSGTLLAVASLDGTVSLWNWNDLKKSPVILNDFNTWVWTAKFSLDNELLFTGSHNGDLRYWSTNTQSLYKQVLSKEEALLTQEEWDIYVSKKVAYLDEYKVLSK